MTQAVISDIHGNLAAFQAVLADIDRRNITEIFCLGDCIGYGPQPEEVLDLICERNIPCVLGNHELGIVDPECRAWFNPNSLRILDRTRKMLSEDAVSRLRTWPRSLVRADCRYVHGCPPESVFDYLYDFDDTGLKRLFDQFSESVCFVGHTHELQIARLVGGTVEAKELISGVHKLERGRFIINIGSVGQPRDGDNRGKYALWTPDTRRLEIRAVPYDIQKTADLISKLGFPETYARRLW